mgnify:CR=1 FL=1
MTDNDLMQPKKITDWENEPTVEVLKRDLEASKQAHSVQTAKIIKWNDVRNVTGKSNRLKLKVVPVFNPNLLEGRQNGVILLYPSHFLILIRYSK